ncbi:anti-sigma factor [Streptomyces sp. NPDC126499]|uniref:anti-sigma factor n=1 Tax=Streptomyces sp. NPDC126499 TaxID=3155314 RepID=UPI003327F92B
MTSTADTAQHPDVSEISDLTEGLLSPSRSAAVRRHLDGCPLCADVRTSLEEIRGLLGTLPGPPRMPAEIAGRIDAALAAEALLNATAPAPDADADVHVSRETSRSRTPALPVAARPAGHAPAATGPGRSRRSRRRIAAVGAAFGAAALGLSLFFVQSGTLTSGGADTSGHTTSDTAATGAAHFDGAPVESSVRALLQQHGTFKAPEDRNAPAESFSAEGGAADKRTLPTALPECVKAGTGRTEPVIAFQQGDYQGTLAYLVLLPDTTDGSRVQAYVLDASCASGAGNGTAEVLLRESVPRS